MLQVLHDLYLLRGEDFEDILAMLAKSYILGTVDALMALEKLLEQSPHLSGGELRQTIAAAVNELIHTSYLEINASNQLYNLLISLQEEKRKKE